MQNNKLYDILLLGEKNMASSSNKKLLIIYILKILQEYSDQNHFLTQSDIIKKLLNSYGMECERKAVSQNINSLIDVGYDIVKMPKGGYYLSERGFDPSEITFLIDAVFSSKVISGKQTKDLVEKLSNFLSKHQRKKYNYLYKAEEVSKSLNKQVFYNIDVINQAIEENKQISFLYNKYGANKKLTPRQKGRDYLVNPYFMINNNGKYYLVCNYDYFNEIANYKIDLITDIKIVDAPIKPITMLENFENGIDIAKYINENIYMFGGKTIEAKIKLENDYAVNDVVDWFGKNVRITEGGDDFIAIIKASRLAIYYWCLQYSSHTELLQPLELREKLKEAIEKNYKKYI